jgi:DNA repair protein RadA
MGMEDTPFIEEDEDMVQELKLKTETKSKGLSDLPGVGPATVQKLAAAGYLDLLAISVATIGELVAAADMSEITAKKVINNARESLDMGFQTGTELLEKRKLLIQIGTGCKAFDSLLGGGVESGSITEAYGKYGSGKSQIAHVLSVRAQMPKSQGGAEGITVFIDTEGTFRPERIIEIAKGAGMDPDEALKGIRVARALNSDHQMLLVEKVSELIKKENLPVKLIVIDSLTAHFRAEFIGRGTLATRQQKLNRHMHDVMKLAGLYNIAVYVTNQVQSKPDQFFGDPTDAVGGNIVAHNSAFRLYLRRGKKGSRVAKLVDSPNLPEDECVYMIDTDGIVDL